MRTTVTLDDDVFEAVAHLSRVSGKRFGKVLSELTRSALKKEPAQQSGRSGRFPTFNVPADAPVIPASRIRRVLDGEGLF